jgi:dTDP-4-dehydrorhamnose 3,5-epimerase
LVNEAVLRAFPTALPGPLLIRFDRAEDRRGHFQRLWCADDFTAAGLDFRPSQISASYNHHVGTLRGLHWQEPPYAETKLVRATRGAVFDVVVDMRAGSMNRARWVGVELSAENGQALLIPAGFAHGFITLTDKAEVQYCIDTPFQPEAARGARFDDPSIGIAWPMPPRVISEKDLGWPAFAG